METLIDEVAIDIRVGGQLGIRRVDHGGGSDAGFEWFDEREKHFHGGYGFSIADAARNRSEE